MSAPSNAASIIPFIVAPHTFPWLA